MVSARKQLRRFSDRSYQLGVLAVVLWLATYVGYRVAFGLHSDAPLADIARHADALYQAMPPSYSDRERLGQLVRQAQLLRDGELPPPLIVVVPGQDKGVQDPKAAKKAAEAAAAPSTQSREQVVAARQVELAGELKRVIDDLQATADRAAEHLDELRHPQPAATPASGDQSVGSASATAAAATTTADAPAATGDQATPPVDPAAQLAAAERDLTTARGLFPAARPLRALVLWLADPGQWAYEQHFWAAFWAIVAAGLPAGVSFWYLVRGLRLPTGIAPGIHLPAALVRRREEDRDLRQGTLGSYFLHMLVIALPMITFSCSHQLGLPGGGGGASGQPQAEQEIKVKQVKKQKLVVNPFSSIIINTPKQLDENLEELTQRMASATKAGGAGDGDGAGYGAGASGGQIQFVVINHGGHGWDEANAVAAPNFLKEFHKAVPVPTAHSPVSVRVSDLIAQKDPRQQPPLIYLCMDNTGYQFGQAELDFLRKYASSTGGGIGGTILVDSQGGALPHVQRLVGQLFPGRPLVPIPLDDLLFRIRVPMTGRDWAIAHHDGDRIMGVREGDRWILVFHPGDLVDGWRAAMGPRWQAIAFQFGINLWDYSAKNFMRARGDALRQQH